MRVLVTGGAGYIGSHTAKALYRAGHQPVVYDNLTVGHRSSVRWGPLIEGDISDGTLLREVLAHEEIEAVVHLAASAYVGESMNAPRKYFHNNVANTLNLLDAMADRGVWNIVFSSTCATYGDPCYVPIDESHPQSPINPYGESKLFVEKVLHWYGRIHSWRWVALRYFNAAGADPEGEIGEDHCPETHIVPLAIRAALGYGESFEVFGSNYETADGTAVRDYIHVTDIAEAHVKALNYLTQRGPSIAINLGTGVGVSVRDIIAAVERIAGKSIQVRWGPRRVGDPPVLIANNTLSVSTLGCEYSNSTLEKIVCSAWRWQASRQTD